MTDGSQRFERNYVPVPFSGCWLWLGSESGNNGYGVLQHFGKRVMAHRFAYQKYVGPIPEGMCVCHTCDVPACVNPGHLFLGSHACNMADMAKKKRANASAAIEASRKIDRKGEKHPSVKLNDKLVLTMRDMKRSGMTHKEIGDRFGVDWRTVISAVIGDTWKHLPGIVERKFKRRKKHESV